MASKTVEKTAPAKPEPRDGLLIVDLPTGGWWAFDLDTPIDVFNEKTAGEEAGKWNVMGAFTHSWSFDRNFDTPGINKVGARDMTKALKAWKKDVFPLFDELVEDQVEEPTPTDSASSQR